MKLEMLAAKKAPRDIALILILAAGTFYCCFVIPLFAEYIKKTVSSDVIPAAVKEARPQVVVEEWSVIESGYFTIYYRPDANLKTIAKRLKKRFYVDKLAHSNPSREPSKRIAGRLDSLFRRAKEILGMYPRQIHASIKIFKNRKELEEEYYRLFNERKSLKSFYVYRYNTIYTDEKDISDSVIAHEMGHLIVDHYFSVRPPEKVRELLSSYVDMHLDE